MSNRNLDHLVIGVLDLEAARTAYARLGFQVSEPMHHSTGTSNHLIMFRGNFLELLGNLHRVEAGARFDSVRAMDRMVRKREGVIATAFRSEDAERDYAELVADGFLMSPVASFTRGVTLPDGSSGEVYCSVTLSHAPEHPRLNLFVSHQHRPQFVWIEDWQRHPNGACEMVKVVYSARRPQEIANLLEKFGGAPEMLQVDTPHELNHDGDTCASGVVISVDDIALTADVLRRNGVLFYQGKDRRISISAADACGLAIDFVQAAVK